MTGSRMDLTIESAWAEHQRAIACRVEGLVDPSIPIAWFGSLPGYMASSLRVITVGLNPSRLEFPSRDPFVRFPKAVELGGERLFPEGKTAYAEAMNEYFQIAPYSAWFRPSFEEVLLGMGASFYGGAENVAIHTDLFSPIATDPTWSRLGAARDALGREGVRLWHDLVRLLEPDVIVVSIAKGYLESIRFDWRGSWRPVYVVERTNPYVVSVRTLMVEGKEAMVVFGPAAQKPFGKLGSSDKRRAGEAAGALMRN